MAPRPRDLVLRDLHPRQAPAPATATSTTTSTTASTPTTRARAPGSRAPSAACSRGPPANACWPIAPMSMRPGQAGRTRRRAGVRDRAADRGRHQPRAAASGALAHRHPGAVCGQSAAARLSRRAGRLRGAPQPRRAGSSIAGGIHQVGHDGAGFSWDNEASAPRRARSTRSGWPTASSPTANGSNSWTTAAIALPRCGFRWLGHGQPRGLATRRSTGRSATASGSPCRSKACSRSIARAPVAHVSYFEADAFARWAGKRLPTEFEWEVAAAGPARHRQHARHHARCGRCQRDRPRTAQPRQMFGDVWEWTQSAYLPYPGYRPPAGALGEYNGKFMVSQQVLRGASCATPRRPHPRDLPQLLLPPPALAVHGPASCLGDRLMLTPNMRKLLAERFALDRRRVRLRRSRRLVAAAANLCRAASSMTRAAASCSRRSRGCRNIIRRARRLRSSRRTPPR